MLTRTASTATTTPQRQHAAGACSRPRRGAAVRCAATGGAPPSSRRAVMGGMALALPASMLLAPKPSLAAAGKSYLEVDQLSAFQKADQRDAFLKRVEAVLREELAPSDAYKCVRLALHDAGTYDIATKTGGFDGSIALNDAELSRPSNKDLKDIVAKLKTIKQRIDGEDKDGSGPISWADLIYLAGKISTQKKWFEEKVGDPAIGKTGGETIAKQFPNPWPVEIGRVDRAEPGPNTVPPMDADVEEIRQWLLKLGAKPDAGSGPFTPKPPFWEKPGFVLWTASASDPDAEAERFAKANPQAYQGIKVGYERSKKTYTRTDYEVDFGTFYNKLCNLGASYSPTAYLSRLQVQRLV